MRKLVISSLLSASLLVTAGCADSGFGGTKQTIGTLGGAAAGGFAGSQFGKGKGQLAMTAGGVLLGALLGSQVGQSLDRADQSYAAQAANRAYTAPIGQENQWRNPESGNYGITNPVSDVLFGTRYGDKSLPKRSPTVRNLGYDEEMRRAFPWIAVIEANANARLESARGLRSPATQKQQ